jgi:peptide/nickel transport system substrate-binding protein
VRLVLYPTSKNNNQQSAFAFLTNHRLSTKGTEKIMKRKLLIAINLLIVVAMLLLSACASTATPESTDIPEVDDSETMETPTVDDEDTPAEPVVLRVGAVTEIDCWNPFICPLHWDYNEMVFEGFNSRGSDITCKAEPRLAESIELSEDGLTWTIKLFEGITFSDGTPFKAQDAVDYINWYISAGLAIFFWETTYMTSIEVVDEYTFQFSTEFPIATFPDFNAVWFWMMAPHIWGEEDSSSVFGFENYPPIGTGPYIVADWAPGEYLIYEAREEYHLGKPPIDRIVYQVFSNWDGLIQAYLAGDIDITSNYTPPEYYQTLAEAPNTTVLEIPPGTNHYLSLNVYIGGSQHPAIKDPLFREALDYAINRQQLVEVEFLGHAVACPNNWACGPAYEGKLNPDFVVTPYDPAHAIQILEDAGYVDSDGDGNRETPDGEPITLRLYYAPEEPVHVTMAESLKGWFSAIGLEIEVSAIEFGTLFSIVLNERDYDIAVFSAPPEWHPASVDFYYSCWSADAGMTAWNLPGYCNPDYDEAVFEALQIVDPEEQMQGFFRSQEHLYNDRPILTLVGQNQIQAYNNAKFELSDGFCSFSFGAWHYPAIMEAVPK